MATNSKQRTGPIAVAPTITDMSMRNRKMPNSQAEVLLKEMGGEDPDVDDVRDTLLNTKHTTKEEAQVKGGDNEEKGMSTMLIIVFALMVIALVALIVWMVMKQNEEKSEEEEMKNRLHPHPRNQMAYAGYQQGMPPEMQRRVSQQQPTMPPNAMPPRPLQQPIMPPRPLQPQPNAMQSSTTQSHARQEDQQMQNDMFAQQQSRQQALAEHQRTVATQQRNAGSVVNSGVADTKDNKEDKEDPKYVRKESAAELLKKTEKLLGEDEPLTNEDKQMLGVFSEESKDRENTVKSKDEDENDDVDFDDD